MNIHEKFINRCIEIAKNALGVTAPNPMVGCVIVHNNNIIGEGVTSAYGGPHAEVNAIANVKDKALLNSATLYVTLEPCSHFGKTPPCSDLIIKNHIPNVVIGCVDDNKKVAGQGIKKLREAGCHVEVGVLEKLCREHHKRFFTFHNQKRPYIILKWAESADGFIAPAQKGENKPVWLSNKYSRQLTHKWRSEEQAILVGYNTVLADNPSLTTRHWAGKNPTRFVLDKTGSLSQDHAVFDDQSKTIVIDDYNAKDIVKRLFEQNIQSIIIEGGRHTLQLFIDAKLWDEARIFKTGISLKNGIPAPLISGQIKSEKKIVDDQLTILLHD